jgi:hypothetical protein
MLFAAVAFTAVALLDYYRFSHALTSRSSPSILCTSKREK